MIYTIGRVDIYEPLFNGTERPKKAGCTDNQRGGSVWSTLEDAQNYASLYPDYRVYAVDADWEADTAPDSGHEWHQLTRDADLYRLTESDVL